MKKRVRDISLTEKLSDLGFGEKILAIGREDRRYLHECNNDKITQRLYIDDALSGIIETTVHYPSVDREFIDIIPKEKIAIARSWSEDDTDWIQKGHEIYSMSTHVPVSMCTSVFASGNSYKCKYWTTHDNCKIYEQDSGAVVVINPDYAGWNFIPSVESTILSEDKILEENFMHQVEILAPWMRGSMQCWEAYLTRVRSAYKKGKEEVMRVLQGFGFEQDRLSALGLA